jgi:hypothetical protein
MKLKEWRLFECTDVVLLKRSVRQRFLLRLDYSEQEREYRSKS